MLELSENMDGDIESIYEDAKKAGYELNLKTSEEVDKAITALTDLHSDSYQIDLRLGWLYYLSKDYVKAEQFYKKAIT